LFVLPPGDYPSLSFGDDGLESCTYKLVDELIFR